MGHLPKTDPTLTREVEQPTQSHGKLSILLLAFAALLFATSGSALMLKKLQHPLASDNAATIGPTLMIPSAPVRNADSDCPGPTKLRHADGSVSIVFSVCTASERH